ncbi:unnamed protein product [Tilletia laevis]|uniref:Uncharacterized protein n=1 Tax=Tilletia laevis TaxID=157183 RepID=A0A9N8M3C5_9BASI|nr:unnamed protein product [Tilletia caries]CAD6926403.1 unnamed protein product [Tilletia laevis]CAD6957061.1 unnamed protein product [Tilletia laevis]CAD6976376.1 unnamed protein product [Tilletia controversa]
MGICANYTYALISTRAFICAAYYESNPHDPGLLSHKPCRTPIVEVALANYIRNLCLITGIINPFAILFWGRFLRRIGPKGLAMIANLSVILFDPIPWILLPLGPPVGTPHPYISANMCKHILLLSATIGAATGMGTLHTLAFRTMLVNVASPNQVTIHLSLFALAAYASTALGPLVSALVVHLVKHFGRKEHHHYHHQISSSLFEMAFPVNGTDRRDMPYPMPSPPLLPPIDPAVSHQTVSFKVSLAFSIAALLWLIFFIWDTSPLTSTSAASPSQPSCTVSGQQCTGSKDADGNEAGSVEEDDSMSRDSGAIKGWSLRGSISELLRPFKIFHPSTLQAASIPTSQGSTATAMANAPLMEFLTYRYGLDGTDLSFLLSSQAAVSGLLVFLGVPALRAAVERRSQKPASLANVDLTDFEEVEEVDEGEGEMVVNMSSCSAGTGPSLDDHPPGVDIERGQGRGRRAAKLRRKRSQVSYHSTTASSRTIPTTNRTQQHRQLRAAFWDWQARIELNSSTTALMAILLPWSLILLGVAFPYQTLSPVVLVLGWIFGSPDGTISSFLQSAGLAVLKSASVDTAVVDDFMTSFNTLSTLVTLASSGFVTVYSHSVQTLPWLTFVFPTTLALLSLAILRPLLLPLRRHRPSGARRGVGNL